MTGGNSLINLGELSKPATVLIEKVSDAVGGIAKPWQIKRVAKAEAEAEKTKAAARFEISEMEERAIQRMVREEGKRQENIEAITAGAIPHLTTDAKPENIEPDKINYLFERARLVSDAEVQSIWSKILAGEANRAGSFSRTTIDIVSRLEKNDANLFTKLCSYVWMTFVPTAVYSLREQDFGPLPVNFSDLVHLDSLGLISFDPISGYTLNINSKYFAIHYYGRKFEFTFEKDTSNKISTGSVMLTSAGQELVSICGSTPDFDYLSKVIEYWMNSNKGITVSVPISTRDRWEMA